MKQALSTLLLCIFLAGCSANAATSKDEPKIQENSGKENIETTKQQNTNEQNQTIFDQYQPNPQVTDDRSLQTVGQTYSDGKGEATLKAINHVNKTYNVGPIELTIKEMKSIHLRPDYGMIDYFHMLTHDEEFDFVKVFVEIKNTSNENVNFAPIALIKTNTSETFDWEKDIYLEELNGEINGNSTKFGNLGFIVNASDSSKHTDEHSEIEQKEENQVNEVKDIKWVEITTSDVFDNNQKKISESQKIKIEF